METAKTLKNCQISIYKPSGRQGQCLFAPQMRLNFGKLLQWEKLPN